MSDPSPSAPLPAAEDAAGRPSPVKIDPVTQPIERLDLTNALLMHSVVTRLQDECRYWRQNVACWLASAQHDLGRPMSPLQLVFEQGPERRIREFGGTLAAALAGEFYPGCEGCDIEIRPGDPVIGCSDVGEMHAGCLGASADHVAEGRMPVPFDSLDTENLTEAQIEALRADPHLDIFRAAPLFTDEQIAELAAAAKADRDMTSELFHSPLWRAIGLLFTERTRQIEVEGYDAAHDDRHRAEELALAAGWYALDAGRARDPGRTGIGEQPFPSPSLFNSPLLGWPWEPAAWKPGSPARDLEKAGALLLAAIEHHLRAADRAEEARGEVSE